MDRFETTAPCEVHAYHSPRPQYQEVHHRVPLSWGGSDDVENRINVCPTGHRNIHRLLDALRDGADVTLSDWGPGERATALAAIKEWRATQGEV